MQSLPDQQRIVFVRFYRQLAFEISNVAGRAVGTVKTTTAGGQTPRAGNQRGGVHDLRISSEKI
jgi:hypothetical protein